MPKKRDFINNPNPAEYIADKLSDADMTFDVVDVAARGLLYKYPKMDVLAFISRAYTHMLVEISLA